MNTKVLLLSLLAITGTALFFLNQAADTKNDPIRQMKTAQFANFRTEFNKEYSSVEELEYRFTVFMDTLKLIENHNNKADSDYTLGINQFSDLTFEEFTAKYLGVPDYVQTDEPVIDDPSLLFGILDNVDWVAAGKVSLVRNQGSCGSCWSFATNAALESAYAIFKNIKGILLSEQELIDCSTSYGNNGCNGGWMPNAYNYIKAKKINLESKYPYKAINQSCNTALSGKGPYGITGYTALSAGVSYTVNAIAQQPVAIAFHVQSDFQSYKSGVYNPASCPGSVNHGVTAVGYRLKDSVPNLFVKNSWGNTWGNNGYFNIAIGTGSGTCSLAATTGNSYPSV